MLRHRSGFGLLECLVVLVLLAAVLMWTSAPYLRLVEQQALDTQLARIAAAMMRMRSEAITRNASVQVCLANLKSNLDIQGCAKPVAGAQGYVVDEGILFFIDSPGGTAGVYNSKEGRDVVARATPVLLHSNVRQYRIRPSGALSVAGVSYTARTAGGLCRQLWLGASGFRRVTACE